jgi:hypothetical protein
VDAFRAAFARLSFEASYNHMMGSVRELLTAVLQKGRESHERPGGRARLNLISG